MINLNDILDKLYDKSKSILVMKKRHDTRRHLYKNNVGNHIIIIFDRSIVPRYFYLYFIL